MNTNPILNSPIMGYARHRIILDAEAKPCDYKFLEVNTTFEKLTGLRVSDVVGRRVSEVIPGIEDAEFDWIGYYGEIALNGGDKEFEQYSEELNRWYRVHVYSDEPMTFTAIFIDITESKKQAEELIASQERYRAMFEVSSDAYILMQEDVVLDCNNACCELLKLPKADIVGRNPGTFSPEYQPNGRKSEELAKEYIETAYQQGRNYFEWLHKRSNGEEFWVEVYLNVLRQNGKDALFATWRDITSRKKAEEELAINEERYSKAIAGTEAGLWDWDMINDTVYFSTQWKAMLGYSDAEIPNDFAGWRMLWHPEDAVRIDAAINDYMTGKTPVYEIEHRLRHKDGSWHWILTRGEIAKDALGNAVRWTGTNIDITELKKAEETIKASEANFRAFFDSMLDMIVVGTLDGRVLYANDAIINTLGYSLEELDKLGVLGVHPADKQSEAEDIFAAMFRGERNFCPLPVQSKSGKLIPVETRVSFGKWNGEDVIFGIIKDLSKEQEALQKFDKLFDVNPAMMALSKLPERKFVEVNRAFLTKLGLTRGEVIGKSAMELQLFADADTIQAADAKLNRDGIINNLELKVRTRNGEFRDGLFSGEMIEVQGVKYLLTVMIDITEKKKAEEALQEQAQRLNAYIENAPYGILISNSRGEYISANRKACELTGYNIKELLCMGPMSITYANDIDLAREYFAQVVAGAISPICLRYVTKSGEIRYWSVLAVKVSDDEFVGFSEDITERRIAEQKLQESEELHRAIVSASPDGLEITDLEGNILLASPKAKHIAGYESVDDFVGKNVLDFLIPEDKLKALKNIRLMFDGIFTGVGEYRTYRPDGSVVDIESNADFIYDAEGKPHKILLISRDISERKKNEAKLRNSEKLLSTVYETLNVGIAVTDENGNIIDCNHTSEELLGITKEQHLSRNYAGAEWEIIRPDGSHFPPEEYASVRAMTERRACYNVEMGIIKAEGKITWLSVSAMPIDLPGYGVLIGYVDITARKQAEEEIIRAKEQFALAVRGTNDGIWDWNLQTNELFLSERWKEILGYEDHELKNEFETFANMLADEDKPRVFQYVEQYLNGEIEKYSIEFRMKHKVDDYVWILAKGEAIRDAQGKPYRMAGSHSDITVRKRAEEATEESAMRLALATKAANVGVWDYDIVSDHLVWDEQMYNLYGITADTFGGAYESWRAGLHPDDLDSADREMKLAINGERDFNTEFRVMWPDGSIHHIRAMAMAIKDDSGQAIRMIGTNWDISEQKRNVEALHKFAQDIEWKNWMLEQEIDTRKETERLLKAAVQEAQRANQAKSEFLANMSHEIRTPMNSILGFSEVMLNYTEDPKSRNYLKTILSSGRTLLSLINDILDLSKIEAGKLDIHTEPANIQNILREVKQIFEQKATEKSLNLILEIEPNFPSEITIDELRLRQILLNLVGNAIKFTHSGYVKIKLYTIQRENITIDFAISIEDTGIGIAKQDRERIFEAFTQQSGNNARAYGGTGLGLAITSRLCKLMNAEIQLESQLNSGSTFTVILRGVNYSIQHSPAEAFTTDNIDVVFSGAKVLIVDDVPFNLELVVSFLENCNLELLTAEDGFKAIELAKSELPDLIFMDIRMPGISGYEATERLKTSAETKHIPIVALTASTMHSEIERINSLFDGYLQKPVQKNSVLSELCKFIEHTKIESVSTEDNQDDTTKAISQEIINDFRIAFSDEIFSLMDVMMLDEIQEFADAFEIFAAKYDNTMLKAIAKRFSSAVSAFDIEMIIQELRNLAQIIKE